MLKGNSIIHFINYFTDSLLKKIGKEILYESKYGIKAWNNQIGSANHILLRKDELSSINVNSILYFVDGLKDDYTLLGSKVTDGPHINFLEQILENKNIEDSEYIKRFNYGYLDMRPAYSYRSSFFKMKCLDQKTKLLSGNTSPLLLLELEKKYYVLDGKHRLSLCKILDVSCPLIIASGFEHYFDYLKLRSKIIHLGSNNYKRHLDFLDKILLK